MRETNRYTDIVREIRSRPTRATGKVNPAAAIAVALVVVVGLALAVSGVATAAGPCTELGWANGEEVCFHVTHVITNPDPNLLAQAVPIYVVGFFPLPAGCSVTSPSSCNPEVLPSGYMPQCDPCFHGGGLNNFPYHDHILDGSPGFGDNGTAGEMMGPWVVIIVVYSPTFSNSPSFTPLTSSSALAAGEAAGDFLPIDHGGANPYEVNTGIVLIFGVQPFGG